MTTPHDADVGRKTWRTLEPIHGAIYFVPEAVEAYRRLGYEHHREGYFASRSAAMGAVNGDVVHATFFNFDPALVRRSMARAWDIASPAAILDARLDAADQMIRRLVPGAIEDPDIEAAAELARRAAEVACEHPEGRPLFAGHASLTWPEPPHLVLWHAQTLLREFRGDGHIAALTAQGLSGCEALITHAATGAIGADVLQSTRSRTDDDWRAATDALQTRGWLDAEGALTEVGRDARDWIERRTDELAALPYATLGEVGCERLRTLARPTSKAMATAFGF